MGGWFSKTKNTTNQAEEVVPQQNITKQQTPKNQNAQKVEATSNIIQQESQQSVLELKNIRSFVERIGTYILESGNLVNSTIEQAKKSESYQCIQKYEDEFNKEIINPFKKFYHQLPIYMTEAKLKTIYEYNYNERFTALNILCMLTAIGTFRRNHNINFASRALRTFRNSSIMYIGGGLIMAPEIYNPILN